MQAMGTYEVQTNHADGLATRLDFICEQTNKGFSVLFGFHKGNIFVWVEADQTDAILARFDAQMDAERVHYDALRDHLKLDDLDEG